MAFLPFSPSSPTLPPNGEGSLLSLWERERVRENWRGTIAQPCAVKLVMCQLNGFFPPIADKAQGVAIGRLAFPIAAGKTTVAGAIGTIVGGILPGIAVEGDDPVAFSVVGFGKDG